MSHDIERSKITGKAEMAFTGKAPWHSLGNPVTKGAPLETWIEEAGFLWEALELPLYSQPFDPQHQGLPHYRQTELGKLIARSDTGFELAIVGPDYKVVQPADVMEFFRDLTEDEGWHIETAGLLRGGRKLWVMAGREAYQDTVAPGDRVHGRVLLATSLDGSLKTTCAFVQERVVCQNTLDIALGERGKPRMEVSHRSVFDATAIKRKMGLIGSAWDRFMKITRKMAAFEIAETEATEVLRKVFGAPNTGDKLDLSWLNSFGPDSGIGADDEEDVRENRNVETALALWQGEGMGSDHPGSEGTAWGLLNAITELVDHRMGRTDDTRMDSAWFGRGKDFKTAAFRELAAIVEE
jgi:phage/plasmid-like protein (TIGR03299 family)